MARYRPGPYLPPTAERVNRLPKWAREYLHHVDTFVGAQEVQEIFYLRDQNRALIKLVSELRAENRRLVKRWEKKDDEGTACMITIKFASGEPKRIKADSAVLRG